MGGTLDVAPALGHALLTTQLGIGAAPGYDSIDLRRIALGAGNQQGVTRPTGWQVSEHSPNGMSVDVQANQGIAMIQGDSVSQQGLYAVAPHASVANLSITAAHATLPRIDQVILRAYDTAVDGLGQNKATLEVIDGTPASGATVNNRSGATSLSATSLRLADIQVPANTGTITNAHIRDRRSWAFGALLRLQLNSGGAISINNVDHWAALDTTNLQARLEVLGGPVLFFVTAHTSTTSSTGWCGVSVDDLDNVTAARTISYASGSDARRNLSFTGMVSVAAGSHQFTLVGQADTNSAPVVFYPPFLFAVMELTNNSADNGNPGA